MAAWQKALDLAPTQPAALQAAVQHLLQQGQAEQALTFAERAVILAPAEPVLRRITAHAALAAGNPDSALHHLRWALAYDPAKPDLHDELADLHQTRGDTATANLRRAMARALQATKGRPT